MIVLLASRFDQLAAELAQRWADHDARLMTCADLSQPGWRYYPDSPNNSCVSIDGQSVRLANIQGVLVCLPAVTESELPHIVAEDRSYVAAEMHAFLVAWLSDAACPVINPPSPLCLMGPNWPPERWAWAAAQAGLRVNPKAFVDLASTDLSDADLTAVTVVGNSCFGRAHHELRTRALRLARAARTTALTVHCSGGAEFVSASPEVDITDVMIQRALLSCLLRHTNNKE